MRPAVPGVRGSRSLKPDEPGPVGRVPEPTPTGREPLKRELPPRTRRRR